MTVRVYRWDDSSAPQLNGGVGSLTALLHAVLVAGYGAKSPAGWTRDWNGTNEMAFTNAGTGKGVKVSHTAAGATAIVVGYESVNGSGVTTNPFPTAAQVSTGLYWYLTTEPTPFNTINRPWVIVADQYRFYMWIGHSVTTATGLAVGTTFSQTYFAGDIIPYKGGDPFHFTVIGNISATNTACQFGNINPSLAVVAGHYTARSYTGAGTSVQTGKTSDGSISSSILGTATAISYPDPVSGGMLLAPVRLAETTGLRGVFPGLWNPLHSMPGSSGDTFTGSGDLAGKSFILLNTGFNGSAGRIALETSDTWG